MSYDIVIRPTDLFIRKAKKLSKKHVSLKSDLKELKSKLLNDPELGDSLGGGLRKIRIAIKSKNKGKSGGARVIISNSARKKTPSISIE